ncbi:MAG: hypothetical protein JO227_22485 [Acetobacteraceae bacterium]|nr:hypothetical protein [Acetobacteraceae bacterium]
MPGSRYIELQKEDLSPVWVRADSVLAVTTPPPNYNLAAKSFIELGGDVGYFVMEEPHTVILRLTGCDNQ